MLGARRRARAARGLRLALFRRALRAPEPPPTAPLGPVLLRALRPLRGFLLRPRFGLRLRRSRRSDARRLAADVFGLEGAGADVVDRAGGAGGLAREAHAAAVENEHVA